MSNPITDIILTLRSGVEAGYLYSYSAPASALTEEQLEKLEDSTPADREACGIPCIGGAPWTSLSPQERIALEKKKDGTRCVTYNAFYDE